MAPNNSITILQGDCREQLRTIEDESVDSIVTDPPYELGFMGKRWDNSGIAYDINVWRECLRVLKPGGHLLSFGGTRTYHRMTCAIEDAGFEVRDCIMWVYGSGFPKSHDVSKAIDKAAGAEREVVRHKPRPNTSGTMAGASDTRPWIEKSREVGFHVVAGPEPATEAAKQWQGWGSALKPAVEPIVVARKPLDGTIADNVLRHGTGGINVDGCRVGAGEYSDREWLDKYRYGTRGINNNFVNDFDVDKCPKSPQGRWPANLIHDGSDEVVGLFPQAGNGWKRNYGEEEYKGRQYDGGSFGGGGYKGGSTYCDSGSAARFFYCAKVSPSERGENNRHPTVKPLALIRYLCRLVTPPKGTVLDPFAGSGTTLVAARNEGFSVIGCELMPEHIEIIKSRLDMKEENDIASSPEEEKEQSPKKDLKQQMSLF